MMGLCPACWCGNNFAVRHFSFEWAEIDDTTETNSARLSYLGQIRFIKCLKVSIHTFP